MTRVAVAVAVALVGCGGGGTPGDPDAPPGTPDAAGPPPEFRVDSIGRVALFEPNGAYLYLYDRAYELPPPARIATDGDCAVYHRPTPSCPAGCGATDVCVADDTCAPGAIFASAGDISITGLRQPATFTHGELGYTGPTLTGDFFADDAAIHVTAAGDQLATFSADVGGVAPLTILFAGLVELRDGEDKSLTWIPAAGGARIQVALYLGWHGSPWTDLLVCETADDGELTIPHGLIEQMPYFEVGLFQWPSSVMRFRRAWAGDVEILAASEIDLGMTHTQ